MSNLQLWEQVRAVPQTATKNIGGGRLKGMTDINPMWRIKTLTEQFGPCGFGWYYEIVEKRIEQGGNNEQAAFVDIKLYVKIGNEWSKGIEGTGGSSFVAKEKAGLYTNDECFKMALTDAISVACKALGFGADIYWSKDNTKYNDQKKDNYNSQPPQHQNNYNNYQQQQQQNPPRQQNQGMPNGACSDCGADVAEKVKNYSLDKYGKVLCYNCQQNHR